jgi:uncharacterized protein
MCKKLFIAATEQHCGKTTTSLSLLHLARKKYRRVGFIKPIGPKPIRFGQWVVDKDAALIAQIYGLEADLPFMSPVVLHPGSTKQFLDGTLQTEGLLEKTRHACAELEKRCDFLIIEGSGHSGVGSILGMSNARIARELNAPVLMVTGGGIGKVVDSVSLNLALFRQEHAEVRMILPNKLLAEKRESTLHYLRRAFAPQGLEVEGGFNFAPELANPTLHHVSGILDSPLRGTSAEGRRIINQVQLAAASAQRVVDLLQDSTLIIVTSTRDELLVMLSSLYQDPEYRQQIAGLVIAGVAPVSKITQKILDGTDIPYLRTNASSSATLAAINEDVSKITAEDEEKIRLAQTKSERELNFSAIETAFAARWHGSMAVGFG